MFPEVVASPPLGKEELESALLPLRASLLAAQRGLRASSRSLVVLVSGVEAAGKSAVVNRLTEWLDGRGVTTHAFWDETDEERERPPTWRFWRALPPRGSIAIFFGSWYTRPIVGRVFRELGRAALDAELERIVGLERMLVADGTRLLKLWFHISQEEQERRLKAARRGKARRIPSPFERKFARRYDEFLGVSETVLRCTNGPHAPWHVVAADDERRRDLETARLVLAALEEAAAPVKTEKRRPPTRTRAATRLASDGEKSPSLLERFDLDEAVLSEEEYEELLTPLQARLDALAWKAWRKRRSAVVLLEGSDAAGKGGVIRRLTAAVDARLCRVVPVAAPTDEERAHPYLWRFWRYLPRGGYLTIFDRSWYGRVLVERVEGFAREEEWRRAYDEINAFEEQLAEGGVALAKVWLQVSRREQLRRFRERERLPHKQHKITAEDWRNRARWREYEAAVNEMVERTGTERAPWSVIPSDDKRFARIAALRIVSETLERALVGERPTG